MNRMRHQAWKAIGPSGMKIPFMGCKFLVVVYCSTIKDVFLALGIVWGPFGPWSPILFPVSLLHCALLIRESTPQFSFEEFRLSLAMGNCTDILYAVSVQKHWELIPYMHLRFASDAHLPEQQNLKKMIPHNYAGLSSQTRTEHHQQACIIITSMSS